MTPERTKWDHLRCGGKVHPTAFARGGPTGHTFRLHHKHGELIAYRRGGCRVDAGGIWASVISTFKPARVA